MSLFLFGNKISIKIEEYLNMCSALNEIPLFSHSHSHSLSHSLTLLPDKRFNWVDTIVCVCVYLFNIAFIQLIIDEIDVILGSKDFQQQNIRYFMLYFD